MGDGLDDGLDGVAAELYALDPDDFTAARTLAERRARSAGDRGLAAAIHRLQRPVVAAWAVNLLAREQPDLVGQLETLGESLRSAQAQLRGDDLRSLARQRRRLVDAVASRTQSLAAEHGRRLSEAALRQVHDTLTAALVEPGAARLVRDGRLVRPLEPGDPLGWSPTGDAGAPEAAYDEPAEPPRPVPSLRLVADDRSERERARDALHAAREALARRESKLARAAARRSSASRRHDKLQSRLLQVEARLEEARRAVADLEVRAESAADAVVTSAALLAAAEGKAHRAERRHAEALDAAERAACVVADLGEGAETPDVGP